MRVSGSTASICSLVSSRTLALRPDKKTARPPALANAIAVARPMPEPDPVTKADFPERDMDFSFSWTVTRACET